MKVNAINSYKPVNFGQKNVQQNRYASYINTNRLQDTFVKMAKVDTGSCEAAKKGVGPSTSKQIEFAKQLAVDLKEIGLTDIDIDENGILTATMKGNIGDDSPVVGLIAHMDTSEQAPTGHVKPQIHKYEKGDIELKNGVKISEKDLAPYKNNTIITSDGTSLLGADDKAGIAEIMEALKVFNERPELKRPTLKIAFTPDEEIGTGVENFNLKKFGADLAYTVDGSEADVIDTETFNAYNPEITIEGVQVHTGHAYGKMVNSITIANEIISRLPKDETPEKTKDREGFYHVDSISGDVGKVTMKMIVRDFDSKAEEEKVNNLANIIKEVEKEYPNCKITFNPNKKYSNMKEGLDELPQVVEFAKKGLEMSGFKPVESAARGGTDGSSLTLRGLPTPNLGTGGINYHSVREFVSLDTMKKCTENIINIVSLWAENAKEVMPQIIERRNSGKLQ